MIFCKAILLLGVPMVLGLSLDTLPHRQKFPALARFSSPSHELHDHELSDLDFENNFVHQMHNKRKMSGIPTMSHSSPKSNLYSHEDHNKIIFESGYPPLHSFHDHTKIKRKVDDIGSKNKEEVGREELSNILKDDEPDKNVLQRERKIPPDTKRQGVLKKKKRESEETPEPLPVPMKEVKPKEKEDEKDFREWLRKEMQKTMARSFVSMRRKRAMWGPMESDSRDDDEDEEDEEDRRRFISNARFQKFTPTPKKEDRFDEVTINLKAIEDALLADALHVVKEGGDSYEGDYLRRQRVSNDLNAAYDIETMRSALFRLRDTLYNMEDEATEQHGEQDLGVYAKYKKRGGECAPLSLLTSDCAVLGDIVPDDSLKDLLTHACNWHEVCYSCGEVFGLSSDNCDMGFVEQSRTICRGDVPCESTARLLLLPLRQRRVFYKRSNPNVCLVDPCVEEFLTRG